MSNATGSVPAAAAGVGVQDKVRWWGDVAKQAYEATDGCLQGFEDTVLDTTADGVVSGMSPSEAEMVKVGVHMHLDPHTCCAMFSSSQCTELTLGMQQPRLLTSTAAYCTC